MTQRTTKTVTISLPPPMVEELDRVRQHEHRTRSELVREALRQYVGSPGRRLPPAVEATAAEGASIRRGREEYARGETMRLEDLQNELGLPTR